VTTARPPSTPDSWEATVEDRIDTVTSVAAAAMHGLLDADGPAPGSGDLLPPLWQWLAWLPDAPQRDLGSDGHPRRGTFLPPVPDARRMYAGGRYQLAEAVRVGESMRRRSVVTAVTEKIGSSGPLTFVEVTHEHFVEDRVALTEVQDLVFRSVSGAPGPSIGERAGARPEPAGGDFGDWEWHQELATDATVLFRFSALTYNAHRIHYDVDYARDVEGYPGLVVHGPLQAIAVAELCRRNLPGRLLRSFQFRAVRPAFSGAPLALRGRHTGDGDGDDVELVVLDDRGIPTMTATAELTPVGA
jgi:3-methylfumaryl-CoA hydratase